MEASMEEVGKKENRVNIFKKSIYLGMKISDCANGTSPAKISQRHKPLLALKFLFTRLWRRVYTLLPILGFLIYFLLLW